MNNMNLIMLGHAEYSDFILRWLHLLTYFAYWSVEDESEQMRKYYRETLASELLNFVTAVNRFRELEEENSS
jgi:hypothetical protein